MNLARRSAAAQAGPRSTCSTHLTFPTAIRARGVFGGLHVGFNYQLMGPIVVGVQGEYNFAGITGSASAFPLNYLSTSVREFGSADARIGVRLRPLARLCDWRLCLWRHPQRHKFPVRVPFVASGLSWASRLTASSPPTATASTSAAVSNITSGAIGRRGPNTAITILAGWASPTRASVGLSPVTRSPFPTTLERDHADRPSRPDL